MRHSLQQIPALKTTVLFVLSILLIHFYDLSFPEQSSVRIALLLMALGILLASLRWFHWPVAGFLGWTVAVFFLALARFPSRELTGNPISKFTDLGRDVVVIGKVTDDPDRDSVKTRFTMTLDSIRLSRHIALPVDGKIQVNVRQPATTRINYGDRLEVMGWVRRPRGDRNPGEFNFERYLSYRGIHGMMTVRENAKIVRQNGFFGNAFMRHVVLPVKHHVMDVSHQTLSPLGASIVIGLLVGERTEIPAEVIQAFSLTGTIHILSLSGLHVVFIAAILMAIFSFFHIPYSPRVFLTVACIGLYVLIGDTVPPIVRAAFMTSVVLWGTLLQRRRNVINSLFVALLIVLFFDPLSLFDIGLQLSFAAVLSIVLIYPRLETFCLRIGWLRKDERGLKDHTIELLLVSLAAQIGTVPFTAYYFYKIPIVSLVANVAIVPLSSVVMALGFLASAISPVSFTLAQWYGQINELAVWLMVEIARIASELPLAYTDYYAMNEWAMLVFYALLAVGLMWNMIPVRKYGLLIAVAAFAVTSWVPVIFRDATTRVVFLDVGQGDCSFVRTASGKTILIDGGDRNDDYDYGERVVAPFLRKEGIGRLDFVIMSHPHNDHIGGLVYILEQFEIGEVIEPGQYYSSGILQDIRNVIDKRNIPVSIGRAGDVLAIDTDHAVYFFHPTDAFVSANQDAPFSANNSSLVMQMRCKNKKFLFMGDAEIESLRYLARCDRLLDSDVIKVGHHGSWNGTTPKLIAAVQPTWAVMSVGSFNKFDHPSPVTENLFRLAGAEIIRTDLNGAVIFETDGHTVERIR